MSGSDALFDLILFHFIYPAYKIGILTFMSRINSKAGSYHVLGYTFSCSVNNKVHIFSSFL